MTFGQKLRQLRLDKKLTQVELAGQAGLQQSAIARWEAGPETPRLKSLHALCKALGVSCAAFDGCEFDEADEKSGRPTKGKVKRKT